MIVFHALLQALLAILESCNDSSSARIRNIAAHAIAKIAISVDPAAAFRSIGTGVVWCGVVVIVVIIKLHSHSCVPCRAVPCCASHEVGASSNGAAAVRGRSAAIGAEAGAHGLDQPGSARRREYIADAGAGHSSHSRKARSLRVEANPARNSFLLSKCCSCRKMSSLNGQHPNCYAT